ncbi:DUF3606 domain-containing protein [Pedobacter duraquae]|uniref:Uncharacterized protein DUF3606 n=1 Tax=Pedobacter duraquae TaxID=425511 RepID=A0A4V3C3P6_9SPHI|nr:DUF3606 domain-containing protein [Pedobacter duraquae]TDO22888.1 uncharacterized protein DUF3606 [Pedobacter duraquae]
MERLKDNWPGTDRINVAENYEVEIWAKRFDLSPERLRELVTLVGPSVSAVKIFLDNT